MSSTEMGNVKNGYSPLLQVTLMNINNTRMFNGTQDEYAPSYNNYFSYTTRMKR